MTKVSLALSVGSSRAGGKDLTRETRLSRRIDVLEDVTLSKDLGARVSLECVRNGVEVVVDGVEEGVASNLGGAAGGVVNVIVLKGDHVGGTGEIQGPVVATIASRRPGGSTVDLVVGDGNTVGRRVSEDDVLAGDQVGGDVVDPDKVGTVNGDSITSPDVLRVDVGETDVLDDDVLGVGNNADTLALNNTLGALADQGFIRANGHTKDTGLVVLDARDLGGVRLVVVTPSVLVDGFLASGASAPGSATSRGGGTLSPGEVEGLGQDNDTGRGVSKVAYQLSSGGRVDGSSRACSDK